MGGLYQVQFMDLNEDDANDLICCICLNIFDEPLVSDCGHSFCKVCLQQWIDTKHKDCPKCRAKFTRKRPKCDHNLVFIDNYVFKPNFTAIENINQLKTKCEFQSNGCQEVVVFGSRSVHIKSCEHRFCKTCGQQMGSPNEESHKCVEKSKTDDKPESAGNGLEVTKSSGSQRGNCSATTGSPTSSEKQQKIKRCVSQLIHSHECRDTACAVDNCRKMKLVLTHAHKCKRRPTDRPPSQTDCEICKQLFHLCYYHVKGCPLSTCPVPYCMEIKHKIRFERNKGKAIPKAVPQSLNTTSQ